MLGVRGLGVAGEVGVVEVRDRGVVGGASDVAVVSLDRGSSPNNVMS